MLYFVFCRPPAGAPGSGKKYDLTKWKYAELRDTINTSCGKHFSSPVQIYTSDVWLDGSFCWVHRFSSPLTTS